ncbi:MAG: hypothetical protein IKK65_01765 [Clostridia bacterium]|nr:hypothetical protein [Clostridia bacterium]
MDTFFEQIVAIRKNGKNIACLIGIWLLALIISALLFLTMILGSLTLLVIAGVIYGAFKLSGFFNIEYEYIVTNGTFDVDKIVNKSSRKRMMSFELATVSRLEKFNAAQLNSIDSKKLLIACDTTAENTYLLVSEKEGKGAQYLVFSPNEKMQSAIVKFLPKFIANSAFK